AVKQLLSTCKAMGINVDGKRADEVMKDVEGGKYDEILNKFEKQWRQ
ncbi:MAG: 50S ribosomal protein L11, partial [Pyrobaculum sp.]